MILRTKEPFHQLEFMIRAPLKAHDLDPLINRLCRTLKRPEQIQSLQLLVSSELWQRENAIYDDLLTESFDDEYRPRWVDLLGDIPMQVSHTPFLAGHQASLLLSTRAMHTQASYQLVLSSPEIINHQVRMVSCELMNYDNRARINELLLRHFGINSPPFDIRIQKNKMQLLEQSQDLVLMDTVLQEPKKNRQLNFEVRIANDDNGNRG